MGDAGIKQEQTLTPHLLRIKPGVRLLEPLSRKGIGPGLIILVPDVAGAHADDDVFMQKGVPSSLMKWAEESYTVVEIRPDAAKSNENVLHVAVQALAECDKCEPRDAIGLLGKTCCSAILETPDLRGDYY
jgi:carboxymethylenebutenolidase